MRLKQIKLAGFKSFVDPTKIPFLKPLTAIVGPNGCGKSNTIDAVRWVLGESSAKNLRGDAMTDVIFNGSSTRRPVSVASVELVFENLDGRLGGQYANYQEISVKRQVNRDAESNYFLNGQKCRRKDITDLFMGTGLGPRSYAIIEQGTISRLIESRPQELRVFIEEAAGISRYKERRRDTENRIRHTRENLERLGDIRLELANQLTKLAGQAKAAKRYREYKQQERQFHAQLLVMRFQELTQQSDKITEQLQEIELLLSKSQTANQEISTHLVQHKLKLETLEQQEQDLVRDFYKLATEIARVEEQLSHEQKSNTKNKESLSLITSQIESVQADLAKLNDKVSQQEFQRQELEPKLLEVTDSIIELQDKLEQQTADKDQKSILLQSLREQEAQLQIPQAVANNKLEYLQQDLPKKQQLAESLKGKLDEALQQPENNVDLLEGECQLKQSMLAETKEQIEELDYHYQDLQTTQDDLTEKLHTLAQQKAGYVSRQELLTNLLAQEAGDEEQPRLWQQINVKAGWEHAVELLLGHLLHMPIVTNNSEHNGFVPQVAEFTSNIMFDAEVNLRPWFKGVRCLSTKSEALQLQADISTDECIVTQDGYLIGQGFVLARQEKSLSIISLQNELQLIEQRILELDEQIIQLQGELVPVKNKLQQIQIQLKDTQKQAETYNLNIIKAEQALIAEQQRQQLLITRNKENEQQLAELSKQILDMDNQRLQITQNLVNFERELVNVQQEKQIVIAQFDKDAQQVKDVANQLSDLQRQEQTTTKILSQLDTDIALSKQQLSQYEERWQTLLNSQQELASKLANNDVNQINIDRLQQQLTEFLAQQAEKQQIIDHTRAQQNTWHTQLENSLLKQKQEVGKIDTLVAQMSELKLKREGLKGQADSQMQLLNEAHISVNTVIESLPNDADSLIWQQELDSLRKKIARLGAINLAAIDEYEQQLERKTYLDSQDEDLNQALHSLELAIRQIDKETRSRFKITFEQINADLGKLFPKVFGGGHAYLALTDDDLLDTGVSIMARPPGKKNSTIHLLSGGEKALTALSLVFAIFQLNPAPFCLLDEVDAPLDDANVERFCRLLKEMSQSLQFIYISHNKITMEMADQLIGVTMHEPGVSRIVAVDLEQAVAMADAC